VSVQRKLQSLRFRVWFKTNPSSTCCLLRGATSPTSFAATRIVCLDGTLVRPCTISVTGLRKRALPKPKPISRTWRETSLICLTPPDYPAFAAFEPVPPALTLPCSCVCVCVCNGFVCMCLCELSPCPPAVCTTTTLHMSAWLCSSRFCTPNECDNHCTNATAYRQNN